MDFGNIARLLLNHSAQKFALWNLTNLLAVETITNETKVSWYILERKYISIKLWSVLLDPMILISWNWEFRTSAKRVISTTYLWEEAWLIRKFYRTFLGQLKTLTKLPVIIFRETIRTYFQKRMVFVVVTGVRKELEFLIGQHVIAAPVLAKWFRSFIHRLHTGGWRSHKTTVSYIAHQPIRIISLTRRSYGNCCRDDWNETHLLRCRKWSSLPVCPNNRGCGNVEHPWL
jgi:hypothetical protein